MDKVYLPSQKTKVWTNVTPEVLQKEIIPAYQPAILKGYVKDWPAVRYAEQSADGLFQYLKSITKANDIELLTFVGDHSIGRRFFYNKNLDGFNFTGIKGSFLAAIEKIYSHRNDDKPPACYIGATDVRDHIPQFETDNPMPLIPTDDASMRPRIWLGNSTLISTHYDVQDNIACVVNGRRRFMFFPPDQLENLYVGPLEYTVSGPPCSLVDFAEPDFDQHPLYKKALEQGQYAELEAGDAVYIPSMWWHNVDSQGTFCALANYWWSSAKPVLDNPFDCLLHGLFAISHLPEGQRKAWKTFFDNYVFHLDGPSAPHLEGSQRGVLNLSPQSYQFLKHQVLSKLTGKAK